ncbi:hypothetical protein [Hymenobacter sp. UYP22]|uniref:hypothetical protein n=1 Tax=Hymenobacter sp. UYP22 TaxID=3156348 RepID=UPI003398E37A
MRGFIFLWLLLCTVSASAQAPVRYWVHGQRAVLPVSINTIELLHVEFDSTLFNKQVEVGQVIGHTTGQPLIRSVRYGLQLLKSEELYADGSYSEAATVLEEAFAKEPTNPFILNQLARSLYRTDKTKPRAYTLYQQLVQQLASVVPAHDSILTADAQFSEAYWKLGTLYMDNQQWPEALLSISQFLVATPEETYAGTPLHEQVLNYQTECLYELKEVTLCRQFGKQAMQLFPSNRYVQPYLAKLSPSPRVPAKPANKPRRL